MSKTLIIMLVIVTCAIVTVWLFGKYWPHHSIKGDLISSTSTPSATSQVIPTWTPKPGGKNIVITSPKVGEKVGSPLVVKGKARVFENRFVYILRGQNKSELYKDSGVTSALDVDQYGDFEFKIPVPTQVGGEKVTLEVFDYSPKDGVVENLVSVPLQINTKETLDVDVYFTNTKKDSDTICTKVFPIKRSILKTSEVAYVSLYQLIQGPNMAELNEGYDTSIPGQTKINSVSVSNGTAYVDFDKGLEYGIVGSCMITAIKSQIESTLKQFTSVKNIVMSIDGQTGGILQP